MQGYIFKENEAVAHIGNVGQKMIIKEVKYKTIMKPTGNTIAEGGLEKIRQKRIDGIIVVWWEKDESGADVFRKEKFHSGQLVPWVIAEKGEKEAQDFLDSLGRKK